MIMLCVDSSGKSAATALTKDGVVLAEAFENNGFTHSQTLLPLVAQTLEKAGVSIDEVDAFAVTNGPGSFTGLRIGCALVKGLAGNRPCIGVPTLLALAYNAIAQNGVVIPMMDARCNQVYTASFEVCNRKITRLSDDRAVSVAELSTEIEALCGQGKQVIVLGDGAYLLPPQTAQRVCLMEKDKLLVLGQSVALAAGHLQPVSAEKLGLCYLRLSQAEREKKMKIGGK